MIDNNNNNMIRTSIRDYANCRVSRGRIKYTNLSGKYIIHSERFNNNNNRIYCYSRHRLLSVSHQRRII